MTYRQARQRIAQMMADAGIENEVAESGFLMEHACQMDRSFYLIHQMDEMPDQQEKAYMNLAKERCKHIPLQYLTGEQEFMGITFKVNPHVLIPRQDTEILVEKVLELLNNGNHNSTEWKVLDMCTGSGCIAVSLKALYSDASVHACDISADALQVARENAKRNNTEITFFKSDLFSNVIDTYDLIVSNPPYIPSGVIPTLMPEVREHEPMGALDGMEDGLYFYDCIIRESDAYLKDQGYLIFEIGYDQGEAVSRMLEEHGYNEIEVIQDLAGLDRVVKGRRNKDV